MTTREADEANSDARWAAAIDCAHLGVWDADLVGNTCFYSASWKRMLGYADDELESHPDLWLDFIHPEDRQRAMESGESHINGQIEAIETEFRLRHRSGHWIWVLDRGRVVERDAAGHAVRLIGVQTDISAQKEAADRLQAALEREHLRKQELSYLARHDGLTGLLNRTAFDEELAAAFSDPTRSSELALLFVDLDRFKVVNDTVGHSAGDALLKLVAKAIRATLPETALIARLGGDEFAALIVADGHDAAYRLGCDLVQAVNTQQLQRDGRLYKVGASVGAVLLNDTGLDPLAALSVADAACYVSKSRGRNKVSLHDPAASRKEGRLAEVRAASELLEAIEKERLILFGQEIRPLSPLSAGARRIEVLTRLVRSDGSLVMPGTFIPAAERFDLMGAFDRQIVRMALKQLASVPGEIDAATSLAVNLSASSLGDPELWPFVERELRETGVPADRISFEITETAAVNNFVEAERFVRDAKTAGCRISLDDFGSGLSSFAYLRRFPVDCIKIDGAFVDDVANSTFDRAVCAAIGAIAAQLDIEVVAERVADAASIDVLADCGIAFGQGFFLHRPEPLADLLARPVPNVSGRA